MPFNPLHTFLRFTFKKNLNWLFFLDVLVENSPSKFITSVYRKPTFQRWSREHKARGQGQVQGHKKNPRPRPRTAFPRTDTLEAKDRNARGQGPRTQAQVLSKKKKGLHKNFSGNLHKKTFSKNFSSAPQNFNNSKNSAVLEPRTGQFSRT